MAGFSFGLCVSEVTSTLFVLPLCPPSPAPIQQQCVDESLVTYGLSPVHQPEEDISLQTEEFEETEEYLKISEDEDELETLVSERFYCPQCNVKYTKKKYLKTHMKCCGLSFHCEICQRNYKQKRSWVVHMRAKHLEEWRTMSVKSKTDYCNDDDLQLVEDTWWREKLRMFGRVMTK